MSKVINNVDANIIYHERIKARGSAGVVTAVVINYGIVTTIYHASPAGAARRVL